MGSMSDLRLTLVAQFDDLVRNGRIITEGIEGEFLQSALQQDVCRKQWLEVQDEFEGLNKRISHLYNENTTLETKLKHARSQIEHEIKKRQRAEMERDSVERQIILVRELLNSKTNQSMLNDKDREKLAFLSTDFQPSHYDSTPCANLPPIEESQSLLSPSDISFDKTEDDLDTTYLRSGKKYKRPSAPPVEDDTPPGKKRKAKPRKHRRSRSAIVATATITVDDGPVNVDSDLTESNVKRHNSTPRHRGMKKYHSDNLKDQTGRGAETDTDDDLWNSPTPIRGILKDSQRDIQYYPHTPPDNSNSGSPVLRHQNSGSLHRPHTFVSKTLIMPETCIPCGKRIKIWKQVMKCRDCRGIAHPDCKQLLPVPCVPIAVTPGGTKHNEPGVLADYAPNDSPMIPAIIIHCVNEVESRGLEEVGIYRVPGSEKEVKNLKDKFLRGKGTPNLAHVNDINVVCGCLKDFLRGLKEPLVTYGLWEEFIRAAEMHDNEAGISATYQAISKLPRANRDTIAFLILHLQRISECETCKMPLGNLTKVFGPTMIGYSTPEPEPMQMISETRKQQMVVEKLMRISSDYWANYINIEDNQTCYPPDPSIPLTPEMRPVPHSMLGPLSTPQDGQDTPDPDQTERKSSWFTPRFGSKGRQAGRKQSHFFASPMLK